MRRGRLQCKDIPTLPILEFILKNGGVGCNWYDDVAGMFERSIRLVVPAGVPDRLLLPKMRNLINGGYVDGCSCGCRGDYELTDKGKDLLCRLSEPTWSEP